MTVALAETRAVRPKKIRAPTTIVPVTTLVIMDEPCFMLVEENWQSPGSRGFHRYQTVRVVRGDRLADYQTDLGLASRFRKAIQFRIPGGVLEPESGRIRIFHTVGELRDIADMVRSGKVPPSEIEPSDLVTGYYDHMDQRHRWQKRASTSGPLVWIQRS